MVYIRQNICILISLEYRKYFDSKKGKSNASKHNKEVCECEKKRKT